MANPEQPELNEGQTYHEFPYSVKLSMDGVFLAVTLMNGAVKLIKMPPVLNPLESDKPTDANPPAGSRDGKPPTSGGKGALPDRASQDLNSMNSFGEAEQTILLKNDIEKFGYEELDIANCLITTVPAREKSEFVDPFVYEEDKEATIEEPVAEIKKSVDNRSKQNTSVAEPTSIAEDVEDTSFKYLLGKKQYKDTELGDLGCLYKAPVVLPHIFFIRASYCGKLNAQMPHPELQHIGKSLKQFYITTGLGITYTNDFNVEIYNIQKPCRENVFPDYTQDYFAKLITARRISAKKAEKAALKPENSLASLIKSARDKAAEKAQSKSVSSATMIEAMRESVKTPIRSFTMPY